MARALLRRDGPAARDAAEAALACAAALIQSTGARTLAPALCEWRAELAAVLGDDETRVRLYGRPSRATRRSAPQATRSGWRREASRTTIHRSCMRSPGADHGLQARRMGASSARLTRPSKPAAAAPPAPDAPPRPRRGCRPPRSAAASRASESHGTTALPASICGDTASNAAAAPMARPTSSSRCSRRAPAAPGSRAGTRARAGSRARRAARARCAAGSRRGPPCRAATPARPSVWKVAR